MKWRLQILIKNDEGKVILSTERKREGERQNRLVVPRAESVGTEFCQNGSAIYSLIEHHDKRTLTVGGTCEVGAKSISRRSKDVINICACSRQRLSRESEIPSTRLLSFSQRSVVWAGAEGLDPINRNEGNKKGGLCDPRILAAWHFGLVIF